MLAEAMSWPDAIFGSITMLTVCGLMGFALWLVLRD
jgi:hypothetical protein